VLGLKGSLAGWDYDTTLLYSRTDLSEVDNNGMPLYSQIMPLLNSGQVNFFGPNTPEIQAALDATNFRGEAYATHTSLQGISASVSRELAEWSAGKLAMALGGEFRQEKFKADPAYSLQIGDNANYGGNFLPVDKSRDVSAAYAELSVPVVKTLDADLALRYDHYQGTGSKTTPKFTVRWHPTEQFLMRGSYGKGFRAPSLTELYSPNTQGVTAAGLNDPARCVAGNPDPSLDCATQFTTVFGGNPNLRPEESSTYTLGVVYAPFEKASFAVDAFKTNLTETIIPGIDPSVILSDPQFNSLVIRGAPDPATPGLPGHIALIDQTSLNFGETRIQGFDVDMKGVIPLPLGMLNLSLSGTYLQQYDIQNLDGTFSSYEGAVSPITNGQGGALPRWHHYFSVDWAVGAWDVFLSHNYQSHYHDIPSNVTEVDRMVASYLTWNTQVAYSGIRNLKLALGVKNLFDQDPPYSNVGGSSYFQSGYDAGYADPRGRFYYGAITYSFKGGT
jgi:iron complex outermembrane receptor protein